MIPLPMCPFGFDVGSLDGGLKREDFGACLERSGVDSFVLADSSGIQILA
jgi:hypothetical protein